MIRIGSLFAGIGGLELGLLAAFAEANIAASATWQVEREPFPRAVLAHHFPEADRSVEDVCIAGASNLVPVDLICGGFPCQDLSYAGKGAGLAGERSGLWREYARIVRELRPRFVVVENVSALLARGLGDVLGDLAALGYDARWRCVRASDVGAPHRRERLFVVAHSDGARLGWERIGGVCEDGNAQPWCHADGCCRARTMADAERARLEGGGHWEPGARRTGSICRGGSHEGDGAESQPGMGREPDGLSSGVDGRAVCALPEAWPSGPGEAQATWEAPRIARGVANRAARLKALGNAVVPHVGREIGRWMIREGLL